MLPIPIALNINDTRARTSELHLEGVSKQTGWFDLQIRTRMCLENQKKKKRNAWEKDLK